MRRGWFHAALMGFLAAGLGVVVRAQVVNAPVGEAAPRTPPGAATQPARGADAARERDMAGLRGATLNSDSDADGLLLRARQYVEEAKYREVALLFQHVLDKYGDAMTTEDGRSYLPVRQKVEDIVAKLPAEGLAAYRLSADGPARALLATDAPHPQRIRDLTELVNRYFMSSVGDQAAYELACLRLDRGEFAEARRLLQRLVARFPDPQVDLVQVNLRLALACARVGDRAGADEALAAAQRLSRETLPTPRLSRLKQEIERLARPAAASATGSSWRMDLGNIQRTGCMPALPWNADGDGARWTLLWSPYATSLEAARAARYDANIVMDDTNQPLRQSRAMLLSRWEQYKWRPVTQVLVLEQRLVFRTPNSTVCLDATTGALLWEVPDVYPQEAEAGMRNANLAYGYMQRNTFPSTSLEISFFGDRTCNTLAANEELVVYNQTPPSSIRMNPMFFGGNQPIMASPSLLQAVETASGKFRWRVDGRSLGATMKIPLNDAALAAGPAHEDGPADPRANSAVMFVSAPLLLSDRVLVVGERGEALWLFGFDIRTGETLFHSFLCAGPGSQRTGWTPIGLAAAEGEVYVATGRGVVLGADATDGRVHWAVRYPSDVQEEKQRMVVTIMRPGGMAWEDNVVIVTGDRLIVTPSDASILLGLDRRTHETVYGTPRELARYVLGMHQGLVLAGGAENTYAFRAATGELVWRRPHATITGRGMLTEREVVLPLRHEALVLDPATGEKLGALRLATPGNDPLGNLYTDGQRLIVTGLDRTYALIDSRQRLALLDGLIRQGNVAARVDRARLLLELQRPAEAAEELQKALMQGGLAPDQAERARALRLDVLLRLVTIETGQAAEHLAQAAEIVRTEAERIRLALVHGQYLVGRGQTAAALDQYLRVAQDVQGVMVEATDDASHQVLAAELAGQALRALWRDTKNQALRAEWEKRGRAALDAAVAQGSQVSALQAVARVFADTSAGFEAIWLLARRWRDSDRTESAELLLRGLTQSTDAARAAAGLTALARFYEEIGWKRQAAETWSRLARLYPQAQVQVQDQLRSIKELAAEALTRLNFAPADAVQALDPIPLAGAPNKLAWVWRGGVRFLYSLESGDPSEFANRHVLILGNDRSNRNQLACIDLPTGRMVWQMPQTGDERLMQVTMLRYVNSPFAPAPTSRSNAHVVMRDGHIGLLVSSKEVVALSLLSGKRLWTLSKEKPGDTPGNEGGSGSSSTSFNVRTSVVVPFVNPDISRAHAALGDGVTVVTEPDTQRMGQTIRVADTASGVILWTRWLERQVAGAVAVSGGMVHLFVDDPREIWTCERRTGRLIRKTSLADWRPNTSLALWEGCLLYISSSGATLRDLTTGEKLWDLSFLETLVRPIILNERLVAIVPSSQNIAGLWLIDRATGKVQKEFPMETGWRVTDVALSSEGGALYVTMQGTRNQWQARVLDLASGQVQRKFQANVQTAAMLSADDIARCGGWLPLVEMDQKTPTNVRDVSPQFSAVARGWRHNLRVYRWADGKMVATESIPTPRAGGEVVSPSAAMLVIDGKLLIPSPSNAEGILALTHDPALPVSMVEAGETPKPGTNKKK